MHLAEKILNKRFVLITTAVIFAMVIMAVWLLLPKLQPEPTFFSDGFENILAIGPLILKFLKTLTIQVKR